jgi:hypothetical protein
VKDHRYGISHRKKNLFPYHKISSPGATEVWFELFIDPSIITWIFIISPTSFTNFRDLWIKVNRQNCQHKQVKQQWESLRFVTIPPQRQVQIYSFLQEPKLVYVGTGLERSCRLTVQFLLLLSLIFLREF